MKSKAIIFLGVLFAIVLVISSTLAVETSLDEKKNEAPKEANQEIDSQNEDMEVVDPEQAGRRCRYGCCGGWGRYGCNRCCRPRIGGGRGGDVGQVDGANEPNLQIDAQNEELDEVEPDQGGRPRRCRYGCCGGWGRYGCNRCCSPRIGGGRGGGVNEAAEAKESNMEIDAPNEQLNEVEPDQGGRPRRCRYGCCGGWGRYGCNRCCSPRRGGGRGGGGGN